MNQGFNGNFPRPMADPTLFNPKMYKKWAQGILTVPTTGLVTVTGLSFLPSTLIFSYFDDSSMIYKYVAVIPMVTNAGLSMPGSASQWFNLNNTTSSVVALSVSVTLFHGGFSFSYGTLNTLHTGAYLCLS